MGMGSRQEGGSSRRQGGSGPARVPPGFPASPGPSCHSPGSLSLGSPWLSGPFPLLGYTSPLWVRRLLEVTRCMALEP